ncbi:pyridoxamine 5'-phosphate oxidase family protein [Aestuariibius sp. 2305UL40-4]|uniref:pyridoxamine 5'-phosphate oxidase family protein n=1 Tax=Aestuariibius violaceus TaxID=3234132 RepID=UPI00345E9333
MSEWFETLDGVLDQVWSRLSRGVADRRAPARQPTFATISPHGWPEARTVVLRRAERAEAVLKVFTDLGSGKIASLRAAPLAALHVWEPSPRLQIRVQAEVEILSGDAVAERWDHLTPEGRTSYGCVPPTGTPIGEALAYEKTSDQAAFAVLQCRAVSIDAVHLGEVHRRALYRREDGWAGEWLAP